MQASEPSQMQNSKEDEEAKSSSSCFSKGGDEHGFNVTDEGHHHPPQILVGSSAKWCWFRIPMGLTLRDAACMGSAQCFNLERLTYVGSCRQTLLEFG